MTTPPPDPRSVSPRWVGWALALALLVMWLPPSAERLREHFLGVEYVDHYGTQWFYWYAGEILRGAQGAARTDLFFFPWGKDVYGHTGSNMLDAWLAQPLLAAFGPVLGYNAFVLCILATNAWGAARLARTWTADPLARAVVALLFTFQPYLLNELMEGRPTQGMMIFVLLFFERLLRLADTPGWKSPVLAGLWLALAGYTYWFYAIFAGAAAVAVGLWAAATRRPEAVRVLARFAGAGALALALVLPAVLPMLRAAATGEVPGMLDTSAWDELLAPITGEGQLVGLYSWQPFGAGHGFWILTLAGEDHFIPRLTPLPLVLLVPLAVLVLRPGRLPRASLLLVAAVGTVFALGPLVVVGGLGVPNPVYTALLEVAPPLRRLWWPGRAFALVGLVAPLGVIPLFDAIRSVPVRGVVAGLFVVALGVGLTQRGLLPAATWDATVPAGYRCLASGPPGAILEIPYAFTQGHLYYQTAHGRPLLGGMLEDNPVFAPPEQAALRSDNTFVKALLEAPPGEDIDARSVTDADRQAVRDLGYAYVVLQVDAYRARAKLAGMAEAIMKVRLRSIRRSFDRYLGAPVYEDARVVIWSPWGLEAPCDASFPRDTESPGRTDMLSSQRDLSAGEVVARLGRPEDAQARLARLVVARNGPEAEMAKRILEELGEGASAGGASAAGAAATEAAPAEAAPTEPAPTEPAPTEVAPTEAAPSPAAGP